MKKYIFTALLTLCVVISYTTKAQTNDTITTLQQQIIDQKANFIGKPFSTLLNAIPYQVKTYIDGSGVQKTTTFLALYFLPLKGRSLAISNKAKHIYIIVTWATPLSVDETRTLGVTKTKGVWTQDAVDYFKDKIVGEIELVAKGYTVPVD